MLHICENEERSKKANSLIWCINYIIALILIHYLSNWAHHALLSAWIKARWKEKPKSCKPKGCKPKDFFCWRALIWAYKAMPSGLKPGSIIPNGCEAWLLQENTLWMLVDCEFSIHSDVPPCYECCFCFPMLSGPGSNTCILCFLF